MTTVTFRFYAELNDFLPQDRRQRAYLYAVPGSPSVKDAIEAQGVPHTEVALVLLNGEVSRFDALLSDGDRIAVYPAFNGMNGAQLTNPYVCTPPEPVRFVADIHLGKLAASLRMLGFDTAYGEKSDEDLAAHSSQEKRILLSRDLGLLKRGQVQYGYYVRATDPKDQVVEVLRRYRLIESIRPFQRCSRCNGQIQPASKSDVAGEVPPAVHRSQREFRQCQSCSQVYWKGSHYDKLVEWISELVNDLRMLATTMDSK